MKLLKNEHSQWDEFVNKEISPPQFLSFWENVLKVSYNLEPFYFFNEDKIKNMKEVFPFFLFRSKLFGNTLVSEPFTEYGGALGEVRNEDILYVLNSAKEKQAGIKITLSELMSNCSNVKKKLISNNFEELKGKSHIVIDSKNINENTFFEGLNRVTRKAIRKSLKSGLEVKTGENKLKDFYKLYRNNMKDFGYPHHSYKFFEELSKHKDNFLFLECLYKNKLIAGLICLYKKDYLYTAFISSDKKYLRLQPNDLLYWEAIKWGINNKKHYIDLGECEPNAAENSHAGGIFKFKKKWGGEIYSKSSFIYPKSGKGGPKNLKKFSTLWKKTPRSITNILGPRIISKLA